MDDGDEVLKLAAELGPDGSEPTGNFRDRAGTE